MRVEAMAMNMPDMKDHPNRIIFEGVLTVVDEASSKPPSGARGHRVLLTRAAAAEALPSLLGMAIGFTPALDGHDVRPAMVSNSGFEVRPTAIYANPVLLDLLDRELKTEFNVVLNTKEVTAGLTVKLLSTQAGDIPLIPDWTLGYTGTPGSGSAVLPAYIVTEDMIEYHWLSDTNPRIFQLGLPGSLASQYVVVKFGGVVVKGAGYAHAQVLVDR